MLCFRNTCNVKRYSTSHHCDSHCIISASTICTGPRISATFCFFCLMLSFLPPEATAAHVRLWVLGVWLGTCGDVASDL